MAVHVCRFFRISFVFLVVIVVLIGSEARLTGHDRYDVKEATKTLTAVKQTNKTDDENSSLSASVEEQDIGQGFFGDEEESEEDNGDSSVSEERNPEDFINAELSAVQLEGDHDRPEETISVIASAFNNKKSFSCPRIKSDFLTGRSVADLSPEDVGIIGALGDSLATGTGLWPRTQIEFRGASFPIGADATIDGLITIPNILREFRGVDLHGVSHGMGSRDQLPDHQLNVAIGGATSSSMPAQANELVRRLSTLKEVDVYNTWSMIIITIGTEEICQNCTAPDTEALKKTIEILNTGIHKAFVILLGPIHVSSSYHQKANLLKTRCVCSRNQSNEFMVSLSEKWTKAFEEVQHHADNFKRKHFSLLTLPMLTVTSRYPYSLFIPNQPLLNRRGHNYATKWLWNRLIAGPKYNLSKAVLSQDAYFCPSIGCPYFRLPENYAYCKILRHVDFEAKQREANELASQQTTYDVYLSTFIIVFLAFFTVIVVGTFFYFRSKMGTRRRFDVPQMPDGLVYKHRATIVRKPSLQSLSSQKQEPRTRLRPTAPSLDVSTPIIQEEESSEE